MASFIHLCDAKNLHSIRRNGITFARIKGAGRTTGIYATPVLPDFYVTHQWVRELRRRGVRLFLAVQFRIPDDEPVDVGRYCDNPLATTASGAHRVFREHVDPQGLEVVIPRKIKPGEIYRITKPPQKVGWRYFPGSHGQRPCACPYCMKGEINSQRLRRRLLNRND